MNRLFTNPTPRRFLLAVMVLAATAVAPFLAAQEEESSGLSVPNTFVGGTPALANEVNENFTALADAIRANVAAITALESGERPARVLLVAREGGDFDSVADAVDAAGDASEEDPVVVLVAPGIYDEERLVRIREFVHVRGLARDACVIRADRSTNTSSAAAAVVELLDNASLGGVTVVNSGASAISVGIACTVASRATRIDDVVSRVEGEGGVGHIAVLLNESDVHVRGSRMVASGASTLNSALASTDSSGPFAQPFIEGSELEARGLESGIGLQLNRTAAQVVGSNVSGDFRGVSSTVAGISRLRSCEISTLGLNACLEATGAASILSAAVSFVGGNAFGVADRFKYVGCFKSNFDPVVDGLGSVLVP